MRKMYFIGLLSFSLNSQADNSPTYDFNNGLLTLPFVNTQQGAYRVELKIDPQDNNSQPTQFKLTSVSASKENVDSNHSPHFNFESGLLTIPHITTAQGPYSASLQLTRTSNTTNPPQFNLTRVSNYIAPRSNKIQTCPIFPTDNAWNVPINTLAVHNRSNAWINAIGEAKKIHMDFGAGKWEGNKIGLPYNLVRNSTTQKYNLNFETADESDAGPYPIPSNVEIEGGDDRHMLLVDTESCRLYELFNARNNNGWQASSGAIWDLNNNQLRPNKHTSADAAGLPIFAGLLRYDEVASGFIGHAIRFAVPSGNSYIWPARHLTSGYENVLTDKPPFGARFRLKADYDISRFSPDLQVILKAMQTYGLIAADNGSGWYIHGAPDERWDNEALKQLKTLSGANFEAVETTCMMINANSAQADPAKCTAGS